LLAQTPNPLVQALETYMKNKLFNETNRSPTFFMLTLTLCFQTSRKWAITRQLINRKLKFGLMRSAFYRGVGFLRIQKLFSVLYMLTRQTKE